jgi:ADP-ribose pyrophosphatase
VDIDVESDDTFGGGEGFLQLRRIRLRNRRADGSASALYLCDFAERPRSRDAVVVAVWCRRGADIHVLLRDGLRPAMKLGRPGEEHLFITEVVAGLLEPEDRGEEGVRARAAAEVLEEAGYRVSPEQVVMLGAPTFPTPGALPERFWLTAVEIADPARQEPLAGDGSPMEEGATTRWMPIDQAIAACVAGDIYDLKTELSLRRLRDAL